MQHIKYIFPKRIVHTEGLVYNENSLLMDKDLYIGFNEKNLTVLKNESGTKNASIILDFGTEVAGGVRLLVSQTKNAAVHQCEVTFGESVNEVCLKIGEKGSTNEHAPRKYPIFVPAMSDQCTGQTGFRFVKLELLDDDAYVEIKSIVAAVEMIAYEPIAFFDSNDERLNKIYEAATRTIRLCMQNDSIWDGVKRDRLLWTGDFHPSMMAALDLYGNHRCIRNSLFRLKNEIEQGKFLNHIPAYSLWWIISVLDYTHFNQDDSLAKELEPQIVTILETFDMLFDQKGDFAIDNLYKEVEHPFFICWKTYGMEEAVTGFYAIAKMCFQKVIDVLDGRPAELATTLLNRVNKKKCPPSLCKVTKAFELLAGEEIENPKKLFMHNGAEGMDCFAIFYVLLAMHKLGADGEAIDIIKEYFGGMLDMGATTFWENFDVEWLKDNPTPIDQMPMEGRKNIHGDFGTNCYVGCRLSLCHAWAGGVLHFFTKAFAGKDYDKEKGGLILSPNLRGLKWVKMSFAVGKEQVVIEMEEGREPKVTCSNNLQYTLKI